MRHVFRVTIRESSFSMNNAQLLREINLHQISNCMAFNVVSQRRNPAHVAQPCSCSPTALAALPALSL